MSAVGYDDSHLSHLMLEKPELEPREAVLAPSSWCGARAGRPHGPVTGAGASGRAAAQAGRITLWIADSPA